MRNGQLNFLPLQRYHRRARSKLKKGDFMSAATTQWSIGKLAIRTVIIVSILGSGLMSGCGPSSQEQTPQATAANQAQESQPENARAPVEPKPKSTKPVTKAPARMPATEHAEATAVQPVATPTPPPPPVCPNCGVVQSIQAVETKGEASGVGAVAGAVAGVVAGNQIGKGKGKTLAKIVGAAGGAYAGHQIEKSLNKQVEYQIAVRMDDGTEHTISQTNGDGLSQGMRVKIVDNTVVPE